MKNINDIAFFDNINKNYCFDNLTKTINKETIFGYMKYLADNNIPYSIYFIDFDDFKDINDTHGHQVGDEALKEIANVLMESIGSSGLVGRFGGDEFLLVLEDKVLYDDMWQMCRIVTQNIKRHKLLCLENLTQQHFVSVTLGAARFPEDANNVSELLDLADKALYRGKAKGKNCFIIYRKELHQHIKTDDSAHKLEVENIIEYIYSVFSSKGQTPKEKLKECAHFLTNLFNMDSISKTYHDHYEFLFENNDNIKSKYIPFEYYLDTIGNDAIHCVNLRTHIRDLNERLFSCLVEQNIKSTFLVRCATKNKVHGYLRIDHGRERVWTRDERYIFQILGNIYALMIELSNEEF